MAEKSVASSKTWEVRIKRTGEKRIKRKDTMEVLDVKPWGWWISQWCRDLGFPSDSQTCL